MEKTYTSFRNFFPKEQTIKLKNNYNLSYFRNDGYCDYRVGCSICERGNAYGFKTNILELITNNEFVVNDLDIIRDDINEDVKFPLYYETKDSNTIKLVFEYYKKIGTLSDQFNGINPKNNIRDKYRSSSGITSIFRDVDSMEPIKDSSSIKRAHICDLCFKWLNIVHNGINQFCEINALKLFWEDFIIEDIEDIIEDNKEVLLIMYADFS